MNYLPIFSTVVTLIFAGAVFSRWLESRSQYLLFWALGLLLYGLGTLSEAVMSVGFDPNILKLWYLSGAMLTAAWLGQGTVTLLVRKGNRAALLTAVLIVISLFSYTLVRDATITEAALRFDPTIPISAQYDEMLIRPGLMTFLTIMLNIYGTITLVGGAIYSAWLFWRKRVLLHRMYGNILIAAGALMPAMGGTFIRAGLPDWLYVSEFAGAVLMYLGFLRATTPMGEKETPKTMGVSGA